MPAVSALNHPPPLQHWSLSRRSAESVVVIARATALRSKLLPSSRWLWIVCRRRDPCKTAAHHHPPPNPLILQHFCWPPNFSSLISAASRSINFVLNL